MMLHLICLQLQDVKFFKYVLDTCYFCMMQVTNGIFQIEVILIRNKSTDKSDKINVFGK